MKTTFDNDRPIYIQLVEQLKIEIVSGRLKEGDRIPSVRELAFQFKVNPNTMQKALIELENLKLIYTERTNGKYVTNDKMIISKYKNDYAKEKAQKYLEEMKELGFDTKQAIENLKIKGEIK